MVDDRSGALRSNGLHGERASANQCAHRLLSAADVGAVDARAEALGTPGRTLMENAGRAVAEAALTRYRDRPGAVAILAGPGKNGGDGYVAARALKTAGRAVRLCALGAPGDPDSQSARRDWEAAGGSVEPIDAAAEALSGAAFAIDALFGVGLSRPITGAAAGAVAALNGAGSPVLSVDTPSGVDADRGWALGAAVAADATVTFIAPKPGHLLAEGARLTGDLIVVGIGAPEGALDAAATPAAERIAPDADGGFGGRRLGKGVASHKYGHGHVAAVAGGLGRTGAARLAARGALRVGAGLATVLAPGEAMAECAAQLTAIMLREASSPTALREALSDPRLNAAVFGPGAGRGAATRAGALAVLGAGARMVVLDADALSAFEASPAALFEAIEASAADVALTPHGGEFARLFPDLAARMRPEAAAPLGKLEATRAAAARAGAVVLFKGPDTVVAAPDGRAGIHAAAGARAAPWLATAGAGDVLAGMIAGLGARGWPAFEAASAGAWLHVSAARASGPGLIAEDLPEALPQVLRDLGA